MHLIPEFQKPRPQSTAEELPRFLISLRYIRDDSPCDVLVQQP